MRKRSRVVTSTACPATVTSPVTVTCPSHRSQTVTTTSTTTSPTTTTTLDPTSLLGKSAFDSKGFLNPTQKLFKNPVAQLGALSPFAALAASNPVAALAALSPSLNIFNPAVNPNAALLAFNPASANILALSAKAGKATLPFGKFGKPVLQL